MLFQVSTGYNRLDQVMSGMFKLGQVTSG